MALDKLIDSQAEDARREWMAEVIQMKTGDNTPLLYDEYYGFAGEILQIIAAGSTDADVSNVFSKAAAGSFLLAADKTTGNYTVTHGLGVSPDLVAVFTPDEPLNTRPSDSNPHLVWSAFVANSVANVYRAMAVRTRPAMAPSGYACGSGSGITSAGITSTTFAIACTDSGTPVALKGGATYYWIALKRKEAST